jgi:hypothetical protein
VQHQQPQDNKTLSQPAIRPNRVRVRGGPAAPPPHHYHHHHSAPSPLEPIIDSPATLCPCLSHGLPLCPRRIMVDMRTTMVGTPPLLQRLYKCFWSNTTNSPSFSSPLQAPIVTHRARSAGVESCCSRCRSLRIAAQETCPPQLTPRIEAASECLLMPRHPRLASVMDSREPPP